MSEIDYIGGTRNDWKPTNEFMVKFNDTVKVKLPHQFNPLFKIEQPEIFMFKYDDGYFIIEIIFFKSEEILLLSEHDQHATKFAYTSLGHGSNLLSRFGLIFDENDEEDVGYRREEHFPEVVNIDLYHSVVKQLGNVVSMSMDGIEKTGLISSVHSMWKSDQFENIIITDQYNYGFAYTYIMTIGYNDHVELHVLNKFDGLFDINVIDFDDRLSLSPTKHELLETDISLPLGIHSLWDYLQSKLSTTPQELLKLIKNACEEVVEAYEDFNIIPIQLPPVII